MKQRIIYQDLESLSQAAAQYLLIKINECLLARDRCILALSGGNTPKRLYELMTNPVICKNIDWKKVWIVLVDERYVSPEDDRSNAKMIFSTLIKHLPIPTKHVLIFDLTKKINLAAALFEKSVKKLAANKKNFIDIAILGLGNDGHTASLFPGDPILNENKKWVSTSTSPDGLSRLTLTYPVLNAVRQRIFFISGNEKKAVMQNLFSSSGKKYPSHRLKAGSLFLCDLAAMGDPIEL